MHCWWVCTKICITIQKKEKKTQNFPYVDSTFIDYVYEYLKTMAISVKSQSVCVCMCVYVYTPKRKSLYIKVTAIYELGIVLSRSHTKLKKFHRVIYSLAFE